MAERATTRKGTQQSARSTTKEGTKKATKRTAGKTSKGFTPEERAAMKERAKELKAAANRAEGEKALMAAVAKMPEPDRAMGKRLHALIKANAPNLAPKTWYGMPAYAKDDDVVCFFQSADKFKSRYATFGFNDSANLDQGDMWPTSFALKELTPAVEAKIARLVKKSGELTKLGDRHGRTRASWSVDIPKSGVARGDDGVDRCWWCRGDPLYERYHDIEWGRPVSDDVRLFEKLGLEGFQSGLSWLTILRKRENFRRAFRFFDIESVARFNTRSVERLLSDAGIVRHRGKIEATIHNARRGLKLLEEFDSLARNVWSYEPDPRSRPSKLDWPTLERIGVSVEATAMSKDLKRRGWVFVGPTTVYSFMEAMGLVNDHVSACDLRENVEEQRTSFSKPII